METTQSFHDSFNRNLGVGEFYPLLVFPQRLRNGKSFNPGILQHSVTFYKRHSCQIWYPLLTPVSRYWLKLRRGYFRFLDFWSIVYKRKLSNSRTSHDIDRKLGPVTKLDKKNTATSKKKSTMTSCQQIMTPLSFCQFIFNLQPSRSRIRVAWSITLAFLSIIAFYLIELETRTKISLTQLLHYCFFTIFVKKC